jgi:predicted transcriptional regulator
MRMTTDIVASFVANNKVSPDELTELIRTVHRTLSGLSVSAVEKIAERPKPATPINKSVQHDFIICLEDGKKLKMLKRYLRSTYGMSPDDYRKRWGLPADYPMVAPAYAARRSEFAKKIGLGKGVRRKDS